MVAFPFPKTADDPCLTPQELAAYLKQDKERLRSLVKNRHIVLGHEGDDGRGPHRRYSIVHGLIAKHTFDLIDLNGLPAREAGAWAETDFAARARELLAMDTQARQECARDPVFAFLLMSECERNAERVRYVKRSELASGLLADLRGVPGGDNPEETELWKELFANGYQQHGLTDLWKPRVVFDLDNYILKEAAPLLIWVSQIHVTKGGDENEEGLTL